ncbi:hypothetical protein ColLi_12159 [Colletotrichum liriopes]|uniref:Uncharacterized protein n=1 Tax=Colletotrichum liriopes TaxID=708192 RepID=A0AA37LZ79_9PEZI|nr:hypothetical protein ColLi_12159 [Colletotrichum liriopes]
MLVKKLWLNFDDVPKQGSQFFTSDRYVCTSKTKTLRIKQPTVDLLCKDGGLWTTNPVNEVRHSDSHATMKMEEGVVYKFTVCSVINDENGLILKHLVVRLVKYRPNSPEIVKRSFIATISNKSVSNIVYNLIRKTQALLGGNFIMSVGARRFQKIGNMELDKYSYIVIDPNLDTTRIKDSKRRTRILTTTVTQA